MRSGSVQSALGCLLGDAERVGQFLRGQSLYVAQNERFAQVRRESTNYDAQNRSEFRPAGLNISAISDAERFLAWSGIASAAAHGERVTNPLRCW
jgi:hypothetical protein